MKRQTMVRIKVPCKTCEGSGRVYMKQANNVGEFVEGGVSAWYDCPTCKGAKELMMLEQWISLDGLKEMLGIPNASN